MGSLRTNLVPFHISRPHQEVMACTLHFEEEGLSILLRPDELQHVHPQARL
jgi:hypothetical protein